MKKYILLVTILILTMTIVFCACDKKQPNPESVQINLEKAEEIFIYNVYYNPAHVTDELTISNFVDMMNSCTAYLVDDEEKDKQLSAGIGRIDQIKIGESEFAINQNGYIWFNIPYTIQGWQILTQVQELPMYHLDNFNFEQYDELRMITD